MKTSDPTVNDHCPLCDVPLTYHKEDVECFEGHGSVEIYPAYWDCPECGWEPGEMVSTCDMCGKVTDDLVDVDGDEYCLACANKEAMVG